MMHLDRAKLLQLSAKVLDLGRKDLFLGRRTRPVYASGTIILILIQTRFILATFVQSRNYVICISNFTYI